MAGEAKKSVTIVEVGTRDGFQNLKRQIPTEDKIRIVNLLSEAGLKRIEVSSFVHPKWVPQLADAAEVFGKIDRKPGVSYGALIPNLRGLEEAIKNNVKEVAYVISASDRLNWENFNKSTAQSLSELSSIAERAREGGVNLRGIVAASFGCPFEGEVPIERVIEIALGFQRAGAFEVSLADTTGLANPLQVKETIEMVYNEIPYLDLSVHFHDTRRIGLANVYSAWEAGVGIFESSIAGLGGCPYAPGAPGNVATEGVVDMFEKMGVHTGVDLKKLLKCIRVVEEVRGKIEGDCRLGQRGQSR